MDLKKFGIICIGLAVLAYAQAVEDPRTESDTNIPKEIESLLDNVTESPKEETEYQEEPTKIEEINDINVDENGIVVDDKEKKDENNDIKKSSVDENELSELTDNDGDEDYLGEEPLHGEKDITDYLNGYDPEYLNDDDDAEDVLDDFGEYDEPLGDDVELAEAINEDSNESTEI